MKVTNKMMDKELGRRKKELEELYKRKPKPVLLTASTMEKANEGYF